MGETFEWLGGGETPGIQLEVTNLALTAAGILGIVLVLVVLWFVVNRALRMAARTAHLDRTVATFIAAVVRYGLISVGVIAILGQLGVDTASLLGSLGIVGLTIGFAARDALSNIISGLFILWDRPFTIGDLIEIDGKYGRVERITMRSTRVVTPDGKMLAIPNSEVVNTTVASYTNFPHLRLDVPVTVGVEEDLGRVRRLLLEMVAAREGFMAEPAARVVVTQLNDYNVALELQAWLEDETQHIVARLELREAIFETLRTAGVHLPYETIELAPLKVQTLAAAS
ncbi:MAG: mechanosensitive ion channel family protein [Sandaracinaceae bacterium]|nr:mechanosensitive ion channel family protein [Sandaracinaceae bacterium]